MPGSLEDKVALVTGSGSGIGRAAALAFAREGTRVVVSDVNPDAGEETVGKIEEAGGHATFIHVDVLCCRHHQDRSAGVCSTRHSHQRSLPRAH